MEVAPVMIFVGMLIFLAHFFVALFEKTRVPDVFYLICIGLVLGPLLPVVRPQDFGKVGNVFTTIALVIIVFEGGLDLSFENLRASWQRTALLTLVAYLLSFALLTVAIYYLTSLKIQGALFVSAVLAGPAPSVVIPLVKHLRLKDSHKTMMTLESPLGEALCIVVSLAVLESFKFEEIRIGRVVGSLLASFVFAVMIGAAGGYLWSLLLHRMRQLRFAIFTTPSFVFILFGVSEFFGFSGPVSALVFGIVLGNIGVITIPWLERKTKLTPLVHNDTEKLFFGELVFVVKTFFFVYIGLSIQFSDPSAMALALALTGVLLFSRFVALHIAADRTQTTAQDGLTMAVLVPKGTAAAVLAGLPLQLGISGGDLMQNLTYGVVAFSIVLTAVLVFLLERAPIPNEWLFPEFQKPARFRNTDTPKENKSPGPS